MFVDTIPPMRRGDTAELIEHIARLRRAERQAEATDFRADLAATRGLLERLVGPTVRPAMAARLLGVTHAALLPWIERGEIATVLTPEGRREIPRAEVVELVEDVRQVQSAGASRPLARVMGERRRRAEESIDLDRLLPPGQPRGHRAAELRSLAYHRLVAERLDERMVDDARRRLRSWEHEGRIHPRWHAEWERILSLPVSEVAKEIGSDAPRARALRQTSPFAGLLNEQERRRLGDAVRERARG